MEKQQMKISKVIPTTSVESWVDCQRAFESGKKEKEKEKKKKSER